MNENLVRKIPVPLHASQWHQHDDHALVKRYSENHPYTDTALSCCGRITAEHGWISNGRGGSIVCPGDWIITGPKGDSDVVRPGIFAVDYESYPTDKPKSTCRCRRSTTRTAE